MTNEPAPQHPQGEELSDLFTSRRVVVGYSGGVTSAWCLNWALANYPREEVIALNHDTKNEDPDTYRFLHEMAARLNIKITERSDGRSVEEVEDDEGALANDHMAFCSRILKAEPKARYFKELRRQGVTEIISVVGFSKMEVERVQRATAWADAEGYVVRFACIEENISKQQCADWCVSLGVKIPDMYEWSDHANCVGCRRGGKAYWLAVKEHRPVVFWSNAKREVEFGHTILKDTTLEALAATGLKRVVNRREAIEIGPCECGS